jgi:hypothetical protein
MRFAFSKRLVMVCLILSFVIVACNQTLPATATQAPTPTFTPTTVIVENTLTATATATVTPAPTPSFQKGVVYTSWWNGEYSSSSSDKTISERIKPLGVNWLSVLVTCYQEKYNSTQIYCDKTKTPTDSDLTHVIQYAHSLGMKVMLKPHVDLSKDDSHWRGDIGFGNDETAWKAWFESYSQFITQYAALAQRENVDYFVIGTELKDTSHRSADWLKVIEAIKEEYKGPLTYAANHDGEEFSIDWWDKVDAIGVDAYYPLTQVDNPTVSQIKDAWTPIVLNLRDLSQKWDRRILFTEVGYQSRDGTNQTPWNVESATIDLQEQADCYQALFEAFAEQEWWQGVFWWNWTTNPNQGGTLDTDFTANNKPAENIVIENYAGTPRPIPTFTPIVDVDEDNSLTVYDDQLTSGWENWSWDINSLDLASGTKTYSGNAAIQLSIDPWGALSLHHSNLDTSGYYWLEFYIYVGDNTHRKLVVYLNNELDEEISPYTDLSNPIYIEGETFLPNQWQRIRIPLADLGGFQTTITRINLKDYSGEGQTEFFVDQIRLLAAK